MLTPIKFKNNKLYVIDQKKLPNELKILELSNYKQVVDVIKNMNIRGAPLIGATAAAGLAIAATNINYKSRVHFMNRFNQICKTFEKTRPTAINLFWAINRMKKVVEEHSDVEEIKKRLITEAQRIIMEDIETNKKLAAYGVKLIENNDNILTYCNAGALATCGYGTALGIIREAQKKNKKISVYVAETRPYLQGARLTTYELQKDKIPVTLICDNMVGILMQQKKIDKVIVGADRIAQNGDFANKIGTYQIALLAKLHNVPFYVAAPTSTFDLSINTGDEIIIEERKKDELIKIFNKNIAPSAVNVYNPAFDITPHKYVSCFITEYGIITKPFKKNIKKIFSKYRVC